MKHRFGAMLACGLLAGAIASAQTPVVAPTNFVSSPFTAGVGTTAAGSVMTGLVAYDVNLSPVSLYVGATQLAADAQAFYAAYPSPQDPIEAIVSSILSSILQKYPQINGGSLSLSIISLTPPVGTRIATAYMGTIGPSSQSQAPPPTTSRKTAVTPSRP